MRSRTRCGVCGSPFLPGDAFPRQCSSSLCGELTWANPTPVAVLLVYVQLRKPERPEGLLIVQRNIEPSKGDWALPGGFINLDETWQEACVRELREETTIEVGVRDVELFDCHSVTTNRILIFGLLRSKLYLDDLDAINKSLPNEETQKVDLMRDSLSLTLCFPTHNAVAGKFFAR